MSKDPRRGLYGSLKTYPVKSGTWTVPEWQNISRAQAAQMGRDLHSSSQEEASAYLDMRNAEQYNTRQGFGNCPDCLGKGDKMDAKTGSLVKCLRCNGTGKVAGEVTRTSRNLPIEIRSTGESFRARRLDQYEALDMIDHAIKLYSDKKKQGSTLLITGEEGTEKTALASAAAVRAEKAGYEVRYICWNDLMIQRAKDYSKAAKLDESLQKVPVLILEDLPVLDLESKARVFKKLLETRNRNNLLTVITSENTREALYDGLGGETLAKCVKYEYTELDLIERRIVKM